MVYGLRMTSDLLVYFKQSYFLMVVNFIQINTEAKFDKLKVTIYY